MAKPTPESRPSLLVTELWGLGDVALAIPFLRCASHHADVTLVAKPHAGPLLKRFAPDVRLTTFDGPWTRFAGKYQLHRWPWREMSSLHRMLRAQAFALGVSARPDPRDHALLAASGARRRIGFPRAGSRLFLTQALNRPARPHRAEYWNALAQALGWTLDAGPARPTSLVRRIILHTGAARAVRQWPSLRFQEIATHLRARGHEVSILDGSEGDLDTLLDRLATADAFIGNDSGPGHLAALLGVPTFTIFGPQLPALFAPRHPQAAWTEGAPCPHKPCFDACRFAEPFCLTHLSVSDVRSQIDPWLNRLQAS